MNKGRRVKVRHAENVYDAAASFLRRSHDNVHRADILLYERGSTTWGDVHSVPRRGKGYYFVSPNRVLTREDMLTLAKEEGFTY